MTVIGIVDNALYFYSYGGSCMLTATLSKEEKEDFIEYENVKVFNSFRELEESFIEDMNKFWDNFYAKEN
jgi:hypothetical protein